MLTGPLCFATNLSTIASNVIFINFRTKVIVIASSAELAELCGTISRDVHGKAADTFINPESLYDAVSTSEKHIENVGRFNPSCSINDNDCLHLLPLTS